MDSFEDRMSLYDELLYVDAPHLRMPYARRRDEDDPHARDIARDRIRRALSRRHAIELIRDVLDTRQARPA